MEAISIEVERTSVLTATEVTVGHCDCLTLPWIALWNKSVQHRPDPTENERAIQKHFLSRTRVSRPTAKTTFELCRVGAAVYPEMIHLVPV